MPGCVTRVQPCRCQFAISYTNNPSYPSSALEGGVTQEKEANSDPGCPGFSSTRLSLATRALTVGAMTRTARGHTGRLLLVLLQACRSEVTMFLLVELATLFSVAGPNLLPAVSPASVHVSGVFWSAGFGALCPGLLPGADQAERRWQARLSRIAKVREFQCRRY